MARTNKGATAGGSGSGPRASESKSGGMPGTEGRSSGPGIMPEADPRAQMPGAVGNGTDSGGTMPQAPAPGSAGAFSMPEPNGSFQMPGAPETGGTMPGAGDPGGAGETSGGGEQQVLIELRIPSGADPAATVGRAAAMGDEGFELDADYPPVPLRPTEEHAEQIAAAQEEVVLVRGRIQQERIAQLEARPEVVRVFLDAVIAPFEATQAVEAPGPVIPVENVSMVRPVEAAGACPISPCDCDPRTAKGDLTTVATVLGVDELHAEGYNGSGVTVAVVDGGITALGRTPKPGETAQIPRVVAGFPEADWGTTAAAWGNHGNMCGTDVLGMAPQTELLDIRIAGDGSLPSVISTAIAGYDWAIRRHRANGTPHILSNSWGIFQKSWDPVYATDPNHPFTRKVVEALDEGILVLFAAGNCGASCPDGRCATDTGPGKSIWGANGHPRVMTVAAVNSRKEYIGYSSAGPAALDPHKPDFCSISHFKGYFPSDTGTSAATPIASGVVALFKQADARVTQDQIKRAITDTAEDIGTAGWDQFSGAGILRAGKALERILGRGRLEAFGRGLDHALWHNWQTSPGGGWSGWNSLGGLVDLPRVDRNLDGRLEAFVIGTDHALWHSRQTSPGGGWSGWNSLGGAIDLLATARNADGRLEVFARGMDSALWHNWQTSPGGGWSGWNSLGGIIDLIATARNADGRLEVFARGMDSALWHNWQTSPGGGWSGWNSLGGAIDLLSVTSNADGRLEVFARGMDSALWHNWQTSPGGGWSGWNSLGGIIDQLATARNADGRLEVFARGTDQGLWHIWQISPGGGWNSWASLGGLIDGPVVGLNGDGRLEVLVIGTDHAVWHKWQTKPGGTWSDWNSRGGTVDQLALGQNIS
ncbi:S8 family serine peptidase [Streptomyces sp. NPDC001634]|uniref:S8 family serine peptidase n=1 Tax=Streptomyces sp. NPDC001634 TaxID=3154390 RepID=UPI003321BBF2